MVKFEGLSTRRLVAITGTNIPYKFLNDEMETIVIRVSVLLAPANTL